MDSHYSADFLSARKADLLRQKTEIETELSRIARFDESAGSWVALQPEYSADGTEDAAESSDESETLQDNQAQVSELEKTLVETDQALAKFTQGTYGRCETTGDWMDEARLEAYPAAKTCSADE
jgi:RNA polymerase-binding transcription factor DksA